MKMRKEDICFRSACELADMIKRQDLSASEVTERFIERIQKVNPIINAYCTTTFELARAQAKQADAAIKQGGKIGSLEGVPTSIKDVVQTKGIRTTFGSKLYENYVPETDEVVVERLKAAGCVILGKTNTPEFGHKGATDNLIFGTTRNPWDLTKTTGGSSGGAGAAVVSGLCALALGSDGGGSIRIPSSLCGCFGLKPNFGRIPHYPHLGTLWTTLDHYGPLVRYVEDAALMLDVMKGPHDADRFSLTEQNINYSEGIRAKPTKLKIGYSLSLGFLKALDPEVERNVLNAVPKFSEIGWTVDEAKIKVRNPETAYITLLSTPFGHDLRGKLSTARDSISPTLVKIIEGGLKWTAMDYVDAMLERQKIYAELVGFFKNYDLLITPTTAIPAFELGIMNPPRIGEKPASPLSWVSFTYPFNMTGLPAASIPCGWTKDGLPVGMQLVGKRFDELTVLQVAKAFQELAPWQERKPQLV